MHLNIMLRNMFFFERIFVETPLKFNDYELRNKCAF